MKKLLTTSAVASMLVALPAFAQTTPPSPPSKPEMTTPRAETATGQLRYLSTYSNEMRASKLIGTNIRNQAGETVGNINEILLDKNGKVAAVVVGVGGFLGIGEREVAVAFDSLQTSRDKDGKDVLTMNVTKDSLKTAPAWTWPR